MSHTQLMASIFNDEGNENFGKEEYDKAKSCYEQSIQLDETPAIYYSNLAVALRGLKQWQKALEQGQKAKNIEPKNTYHAQVMATIHNAEGNEHFSKEEFDKAEACYERAIQQDGTPAIYYSNLAVALRGLKQWKKAVEQCQKAKDMEPENPYHSQIMATIHNAEGNEYFTNADFTGAKACYENAIKQDEKSAIYHLNLALALRDLKDWQQSIAECQKAKELEPDNSLQKQVLASIYNAQGNENLTLKDFGSSKANFETAIQVDDSNAVYHSNLGVALQELGDWQLSSEEFRKAIALEPANTAHRRALGNLYAVKGNKRFHDGDYVDAKAQFENAIQEDDKVAIFHANLAVTLRQLKDWQAAFVECQKAIDIEPENAAHFDVLAGIHNEQGNEQFEQRLFEEAKASYEKAIQLDSKPAIYYSNLAVALRELKDWKQSIAQVQKAKDLEPENDFHNKILATIYNALGLDSYEKGDYVDARANFEKAIELNQTAANYYSNLALAFRGLKDWKQAIEQGQKARDLDPENEINAHVLASNYFEEGNHYAEESDFAAARVSFEKAVEFDGENSVYWANLALVLRILGGWQQAATAVRKAIEMEPENISYTRILRDIYKGEGDELLTQSEYKAAIQKYEEANRVYDSDDALYSKLALAWVKLGEPGSVEKAIALLRKAAELSPTSEEYAERIKLLEALPKGGNP